MTAQVLRVLVVEDDADVRAMLAELLPVYCFAPVFAATGTVALDLAAQDAPDVALIDLVLPGQDGTEVAAALHVQHPRLRLVLYSGKPETEQFRAVARAMGVDQFVYVQKPFDVDALVAALRPT